NQDYDDFGRIITRPSYGFLSVFDFATDKVYNETNIGIDPKTGAPITPDKKYIASRDGNIGFFIQDNWKVKPILTLNVGVRWEDFGNPRHRFDATTNVEFPTGSDYISRITNARVDYTAKHRLYAQTDKTNIAPRSNL